MVTLAQLKNKINDELPAGLTSGLFRVYFGGQMGSSSFDNRPQKQAQKKVEYDSVMEAVRIAHFEYLEDEIKKELRERRLINRVISTILFAWMNQLLKKSV